MAAQASMKHVRITPRKMRVVCKQIRGRNAQDVVEYLTHCRRRAAAPLLKLLKSALANAEQKGGVDLDNLYVKELLCDKGSTLKRWMPRARVKARPVLKRSWHVKVVLDEK